MPCKCISTPCLGLLELLLARSQCLLQHPLLVLGPIRSRSRLRASLVHLLELFVDALQLPTDVLLAGQAARLEGGCLCVFIRVVGRVLHLT